MILTQYLDWTRSSISLSGQKQHECMEYVRNRTGHQFTVWDLCQYVLHPVYTEPQIIMGSVVYSRVAQRGNISKELQIASVKHCLFVCFYGFIFKQDSIMQAFQGRLKVKDDAVLSLTILDPSVMLSKHVFTTIALSVPDRLIYTEYLYGFNPDGPCCFQST